MFKRPHSAKTTAPLRSSDLRKLRDSLASTFPSSSPHLKKLLPDGTLAAKASTHLDEPLTVYYAPAASSSADPDPRLFRIGKGSEGELVPTCYAFDLVPHLLPVLETAEAVVENLQSGSALFAAGVSQRSLRALPDTINEGDLVAIAVAGEFDKVVAVGHLAASKQALLKEDKKGKAVLTLHARGDFLWTSGSGVEASPLSSASAATDPFSAPASTNGDGEVSSLSADVAATSLDSSPPPPPSADLSPTEVDSLLNSALLLSVRSLSSSPNLFPMTASTLYSSHILPARPAGTPLTADLKKSTYKKLQAFMKEGKKRGLLVTKEVKGEVLVMSVNGKHPDVEALRPFRTLAQDAAAEAKAAAASASSSGADASSSAPAPSGAGAVTVQEYFKPSGAVREFLGHVEHDRPPNDLYPPTLLRTSLLSFASKYALSHPRDQKYLLLSPTSHPSPSSLSLEQLSAMELLAAALLKKGEDLGMVSKEEASKRLRAACTGYWGVRQGGGEETVKKGTPPTVRVQVKNVGKRQVTLVSGHEAWGLFSSEDFAEELKHKSASSTSIQPLAGSAKKGQTPKVEIMCQGTHDALVTKLLLARGVPKAYVDLDLTKSKK
ncbi:hypothetical protein JCM21900_002814 [Sporobolomyces salmonicolor]